MAKAKKNPEVVEEQATLDQLPLEETATAPEEAATTPTEAAETAEAPVEASTPKETITLSDAPDTEPEIPEPKEPTAEEDEPTQLTLSLPKAMFDQSMGSLDRLRAAISSKQTLLKKALGTESLEFQVEEDRISFPWFTLSSGNQNEEIDAFSKLVFALAKKAITQTRVSAEEKVNEDLRLGMRLYLINLGFVGDEYKSARAVLMRNFPTGSGGSTVRNTEFTFTMPEIHIGGKS